MYSNTLKDCLQSCLTDAIALCDLKFKGKRNMETMVILYLHYLSAAPTSVAS